MWQYIGNTVSGRLHDRDCIPCQDKVCGKSLNHTHVIALADGAGSALYSHFGAETVVESACDEIASHFEDYIFERNATVAKERIISKLLRNLDETSKKVGCSIKDLACTLMLVAVKESDYLIIHLGDGVIGYMEGSELKVASNPSNGEFVNTTTFITSSDAIKSMKVMKGSLRDINGFVIMTDGTSASLYQKRGKTLSVAIGEIFKYMKYLPLQVVEQQIQASLELVVKRATQDDCGIAFLTNTAKSFDGYLFLTVNEKADLLGIKGRGLKKRVKRYDKILTYLSSAKSQIQLSRYLKLKNKYARRHLNRLLNMNFIEVTREGYRTILMLSRKY